MNKKFKVLAKREYNDRLAAPKDYNMMVDSIMSLTGSYNSKSKAEYAVPQSTQAQIQRQRNATPQKSQIFHDLAPGVETKPLLPENLLTGFNKSLSRQLTLESNDDFGFRPTGNPNASIYSRQGSLSQLLTTFSALKRQDSYDLNDKGVRKKIKWDTADGNGTEDLNKENFTTRQGDTIVFQNNLSAQNDSEDFLNLALPSLSKKASNISQGAEEMPSLSRFNSNLSFLYDK